MDANPGFWARVTKARAASRSPEPHIHRHMPSPRPLQSVTMALKFVLAVPSGLVKLSHSYWMCPEEILGHGRGRGHSSKTQCYCYCGFFILLKGFCGDFETVTAIFQGEM